MTTDPTKPAHITTVDDAGLKFLAGEEGVRLDAYLDERGVPTIGIGMCTYPVVRPQSDGTSTVGLRRGDARYWPTKGQRVLMGDQLLSEADAWVFFGAMLEPYEATVDASTRDDITQEQFNSLTSFCYNVGQQAYRTSRLCKMVNGHADPDTIRWEFGRWVHAGTAVSPGLVKRRGEEADLYITGLYPKA